MVLTMSLALTGWLVPANAQTPFTWPSEDRVDVTRYGTAEECLAAIQRVQRREAYRGADTLWVDTLPHNPGRLLAPLPRPVTEAARGCGARYTEPKAPLEDFSLLVRIYLAAERDADAEQLITRRLAAITGAVDKAGKERAAVLDSLINIYSQARPLRLAKLEWLANEHAKAETDWPRRAMPYTLLAHLGRELGDIALARRTATQLMSMAGQFTPAERRRFEAQGGALAMMIAALALIDEQALLDSLRRSTAGYAALVRETWERASGMRAEALPLPYGETAAPIAADFWFGTGDPAPTRPSPGRVSLVAFINKEEGCFSGITDELPSCWIEAAVLRRLAQRFPALEITLVSHTKGQFVYAEPPTPAQEAELTREWLLGAHRIPAALAVIIPPSLRLPEPDGRPIWRDSPSMTAYSFGKRVSPTLPGVTAYLIDQDGKVVHYSHPLHGRSEADFAGLIGVLLTRTPGGQ
jgi:hypothetical protein